MSTTESFQVVAALGGALGVLGMLAPTRSTHGARRAGSLALTVASWGLLLGSLISRDDLSALGDRISGVTRVGIVVVGGLIALGLGLLAVRACIRRPVVWVVLLAIAAPIRLPISLGGDRAGNLLVPLYAVITIGLVAWGWGRRTGAFAASRPDRAGLIDLAIGSFTAFSLASTLWSDDIAEATTKIVFFYIPFALLYWLVRRWWAVVAEPTRALATTTLAMGAAIAVVAIGQFATKTIWWNDTLAEANIRNRFFRANSIFYDPNILGRYLMMALVIATAYLCVTHRGRTLTVLTVALAVMTIGLAVTLSQSSALGLIAALVILALRVFGVRRTALVGAATLALVGVPAVIASDGVRDKVTSVRSLASDGGGRLSLAKGGINLWKTQPIEGIGLGAFGDRYRDTFSRRDQLRTRVFISHTAPITVLAELGLVGFGLFIFAAIAAVGTMWRASRPDDGSGRAAWVALAILIGIVVHSLFYSGLFEDPFTWIVAGVGAALASARVGAPATDNTTRMGVVTPQPVA